MQGIEITSTNYLFDKVILPIGLGILSFIGANRFTIWCSRKRESKITAAVLSEFIEELKIGLQIMSSFRSGNEKTFVLKKLPRGTWNGMNSLSDERLERIISVSNKKNQTGFSFTEIRSHLKNYFEHTCTNFENILQLHKTNPNWIAEIQQELNDGDLITGAETLLVSLLSAKTALLNNSKKLIPN